MEDTQQQQQEEAATRTVFSRLHTLDPDAASKTMGYILLHDHHQLLLPRLASAPDSHLLFLILQAKSFLQLTSAGGPCLYFARGFCKNGAVCRFSHTRPTPAGDSAVSPRQYNLCFNSPNSGNASPTYNKCLNFLQGHINPRSGSFGLLNPSAQQIYLTFPADSTFSEEDVSNYFSIYGPVQDVRIPYQQKRMFGFVTFLYPDTVKLILAKGNPHFVCDSRVLVKPYKEKGKTVDKKQLQRQQLLFERGEYSISPCSSPSGVVDTTDPFNLSFGGGRMYHGNHQETLLRKKLEDEADYNFRQVLELQSRRLANLQLRDLKNHHFHRHHQFSNDLSNGSPISDYARLDISEGDNATWDPIEANKHHTFDKAGMSKEESSNLSLESDNDESLEHILPENLFASPKKSATTTERPTMFSASCPATDDKPPTLQNMLAPSWSATSTAANPIFSTKLPSSALAVESSVNSVLLQLPRLSSSHGAIGM